MEKLAAESWRRAVPRLSAVERISGNRESQMGKVDTNLVHAPGARGDYEQGVFAESFENPECRFRVLPFSALGDGPTKWIALRARDWKFYTSVAFRHHTVHQSKIFFVNAALLEFPFQVLVHFLRARNQQDTGRFLVETVHDTRTFFVFANIPQARVPLEKRINECRLLPDAFVHRDTRRLIQYQKGGIFMKNAERRERRSARGRNFFLACLLPCLASDGDDMAAAYGGTWLHHTFVRNGNETIPNGPLNITACLLWKTFKKKDIEPHLLRFR